jgi:hypothetical protein
VIEGFAGGGHGGVDVGGRALRGEAEQAVVMR